MDEATVKALLSGKRRREAEAAANAVAAEAPTFDDAWQLDVKLSIPSSTTVREHANRTTTTTQVPLPPIYCTVRPLKPGDEEALVAFGLRGLSAESRRLFAPYSWAAPTETLMSEFSASIANSMAKRDLHIVATASGKICAYAFLWSVSDEVPELGIAVADALHGRGLGRKLLALLERVCLAESKPAIELTTMQDNAAAHVLYLKAGYEDLGLIRNPLGVDVTAAFVGSVVASTFSDELHMCRILDESARARILESLAAKRRRAAELFGEVGSSSAAASDAAASDAAAGDAAAGDARDTAAAARPFDNTSPLT
jgi:RimJ/RimL family protein N-acetyltransferase